MKNSGSSYYAAALLVLLCVTADRLSKAAAGALQGTPPESLAGGLVTLTYAENSGALLGIGAGFPEGTRFLIFTAGIGLLLAIVAAVLIFARALSRIHVFALSLLLAGGGSNLFDRLFNNGRVVDFIVLGAGPLKTGVFNVADIAILLGGALLLLATIRNQSPRQA